jgi:hypothetical protein
MTDAINCPHCGHPLNDEAQAVIARALAAKGGRAGAGSPAKLQSAKKAAAARWDKYRAQAKQPSKKAKKHGCRA